MGDIALTPGYKERFRPDFRLPDYNIIIEVAGVYWHTRPGSYERDAMKAFLLEATGWRTYVLTDFEILQNVSNTAFNSTAISAFCSSVNSFVAG